jgi:hypothetical protein
MSINQIAIASERSIVVADLVDHYIQAELSMKQIGILTTQLVYREFRRWMRYWGHVGIRDVELLQ